jgi:hypothetical protein
VKARTSGATLKTDIQCGEKSGLGPVKKNDRMTIDAKPTVYLFGTSHSYQWAAPDCSAAALAAFKSSIADLVRQHEIHAVAEEMSLDALRMHGRDTSSVHDLCLSNGWKHIYCDPGVEQQRQLGIANDGAIILGKQLFGWTDDDVASRISAEYEKREHYWIERIRSLSASPVLLVCGALHVSRLQQQAHGLSVTTVVAAENWTA